MTDASRRPFEKRSGVDGDDQREKPASDVATQCPPQPPKGEI